MHKHAIHVAKAIEYASEITNDKPGIPFSVSVKQSIIHTTSDIVSKNINTCLDYCHTDKLVCLFVCKRLEYKMMEHIIVLQFFVVRFVPIILL